MLKSNFILKSLLLIPVTLLITGCPDKSELAAYSDERVDTRITNEFAADIKAVGIQSAAFQECSYEVNGIHEINKIYKNYCGITGTYKLNGKTRSINSVTSFYSDFTPPKACSIKVENGRIKFTSGSEEPRSEFEELYWQYNAAKELLTAMVREVKKENEIEKRWQTETKEQ